MSSAKSLMLLLIESGMSFMYMRKRQVPKPSPEGHQKGLGKSQNAPHPGLRSRIYLVGMI